ncbi:MAG: hypothetical protein ACREXY_24055, partial [Gammaproteobacteria bacterium]
MGQLVTYGGYLHGRQCKQPRDAEVHAVRPRTVLGRRVVHVYVRPEMGQSARTFLGFFTDVAQDASFGSLSLHCVSSGPSSDGLVTEDQLT